MQVANALNNHIRILFNPKVEAFKLFDFLVAKSNQDRYLAQIIEIYEDKFDASQNVAKLKLFYKINENDEVMPYDNFTPNRECEILRIQQEEVEDFINQDKEVFHFATNAKEFTPLNMQYDFFNSNPIILADKIENANTVSLNLAKNLSSKKHVVIVDSSGILDFEGAKKIKAAKNFKMPLNYSTINYIFDICLKDSSLEFQAIGSEIINEVKKFARSQENGFIPFNTFTKVLLQQYKATPYPELRLLLARIKKFQMDELFARNKKDTEALFKAIQKNPALIIDLSNIETQWQKAYLEYIITDLEEEVYLIARINDDNFDVDLINKIYNAKKNISFIPNVSYNYKKLPSIVQHCKNYILMPSLYQRTDFLDANFALSNLISDGCIIFGQNTDNFLYIASDLEPQAEQKKGNYRKIALSMAGLDQKKQQQSTPRPPVKSEALKQDETIEKEIIDNSNKAIDALKDFEQEQIKENLNKQPETQESTKDEFVTLENKDDSDSLASLAQHIKEETIQTEKDEFQNLVDNSSLKEEVVEPIEETKEDEPIEELSNVLETSSIETLLLGDEPIDILDIQPRNEVKSDINVLDAELIEFGIDDVKPLQQPKQQAIEEFKEGLREELMQEVQATEQKPDILAAEEEVQPQVNVEKKESKKTAAQRRAAIKEAIKEQQENDLLEKKPSSKKQPAKKEVAQVQPKEQQTEQPKVELKQEQEELKEETIELSQDENVEFSDEELDFFQLAQQGSAVEERESNAKKEKKTEIEPEQEKPSAEKSEDDLDLLEMANKSIDNNFNDILNSSKEQEEQKTETLNIEVSNSNEKAPLPVYKEEQAQKEAHEFKAGDGVVHSKYGKGVVVKVVQYEKRQLLQIEFAQLGKKLLDPKVADIQPE